MKKELNKELYSSPECEALEMKQEGVICASGNPQWNSPFNPEQKWEKEDDDYEKDSYYLEHRSRTRRLQ
ncbi:MAG: hypothetical protein J6V81_05750 [Bacteroidales bacterium]|nr:hypothetical protein [Bacteroidales bacterium]